MPTRLRRWRRRGIAPWLVLVLLATLAAGASCRNGTGDAAEEVPAVDLAAADPAAREKLTRVRGELEAALSRDAGPAERAAAWGRLAEHYHAYRFHAAADVCYGQARALAPREPRWAYLAGVLAQQQGRFAAARSALEEALARRPGYPPARLRLADVLRLEGDEEAARRLYEGLAEEPGFGAAARGQLGRLALAAGRPGEAAEHLRRALESQPTATELHHPLAMALKALGDAGEAERLLARGGGVPARHPDPLVAAVAGLRTGVPVYLDRAGRAAAEGDWETAVGLYEEALRLEPDDPAVLRGLAGTLAARGERRRAIELYRRVLGLDPGQRGVRTQLARLLELEGETAHALDQYRAAAEEGAGAEEAHLHLAGALLRAGRPGDAALVFDRFLEAHPGDRRALLGRVQALAAGGRGDAARRSLASFLDGHPDDLEARLLAGQLATRAGAADDGEAAFRAVLGAAAAAPGLKAAAAHNLGNLLASAGRLEEARGSYSRAVELDPALVPARVALAEIHLRGGEAGAAAGQLAAAVATAPDRLDLRLLEVRALAADGREVVALQRLDAALERFPDEPRLLALRRQISAP
jgi:tetratricopeptide (TPR) repeat protein